MADLPKRLAQTAQALDAAYESLMPDLERSHRGEWVALSPGKAPIFGPDEDSVRVRAREEFSGREYALWRVGYEPRWRSHQR